MIILTLPDGATREVEPGTLARDVVASIGARLLRDLSMQLNLRQDKDQLVSQAFVLDSDDLKAMGQVRVVYETELKKRTGALQNKNARQLKGLLIRIDNQVSRADMGILGPC